MVTYSWDLEQLKGKTLAYMLIILGMVEKYVSLVQYFIVVSWAAHGGGLGSGLLLMLRLNLLI